VLIDPIKFFEIINPIIDGEVSFFVGIQIWKQLL